MKISSILFLLTTGLLVSCSSDAPYHPATGPERIEFRNDRLDVYPGDVRKDPARYSKLSVAWAGIIVSNEATEEVIGGKIRMDTVFENHYFDWEQDEHGHGVRLLISPRGEGLFRMRWRMTRDDPEASYEDAMKYAAPGKLAIVYGTPISVDADGTVVMRYHYIRTLGPAHFSANELDYGRIGGEPFRPIDAKPKISTNSPSH